MTEPLAPPVPDCWSQYAGRKLKSLRAMHGLTQARLAESINTTANTVHRWESAYHPLSLCEIDRLAKYFRVSRWEFVPPPVLDAIKEEP